MYRIFRRLPPYDIQTLISLTACSAVFLWLTRSRMVNHEYLGELSLIFLAALVYILVVLPHELGHLVGGKLTGMRFGSISIMGFCLGRRINGWSLSLSLTVHGGGSCMMYPTDTRDLRRRYLLDVACGPILGLVSVAVYESLYLLLRPSAGSTLASILGGAVLLGLIVNLSALWPDWPSALLPGYQKSDGYHMRRLLRGGPAAEKHIAMTTVARLDSVGYRYDEMDSQLLNLLGGLEPGADLEHLGDASSLSRDAITREAVCAFHAYYWNLAMGDYDQAEPHLSRWEAALKDDYSTGASYNFALERAFFVAYHRRDTEAAQRYLSMVPATVHLPGLRARAEAALQLALGDRDRARQAAERGLELAAALQRSEWNLSRIVLRDLRALHATATENGTSREGRLDVKQFGFVSSLRFVTRPAF